MRAFLILSMLLFSPAAIAQPTANLAGSVPQTPTGIAQQARADISAANPFDRIQINNDAQSDRICLKIRAFIFETNDDQVPRFVRETTCMPVTPKTQNVVEPTAPKLVPATVK